MPHPTSLALARDGLLSLRALNKGAPYSAGDREILAKWPGWGVYAQALDPEPQGGWADIADELANICTDEQLRAAEQTVDTSFFTPPHIVDLTWNILGHAGFTGGKVLDIGCGTGRYGAQAPAHLDIEYVGVDPDKVSSAIAQITMPHAVIHASEVQNVSLPPRFDVVVGNVPFSAAQVWDSASGILGSLHRYCILRGLHQLREGGYLVVLTSRYSVDGKQSIVSLPDADFIGALRLPAGTFPGTGAVADLIVLRKNTEAHVRRGWAAGQNPITPGGQALSGHGIHRYWAENPEHVAGVTKATGNFQAPLTVESADPDADIQRALDSLVARVKLAPWREADPGMGALAEDVECIETEGTFVYVEDVLMQSRSGVLEPVKRVSKELAALIELRDAAVALIEAEGDPSEELDESIKPVREHCRRLYEAYVATFGALNRGILHEGAIEPETGMPALSWRRPSLGGFRSDPKCPIVLAIEDYDPSTGDARPAPILLRRVNREPQRIESAGSPGEALSVCLGELGRVDMARIADLLGLDSADSAAEALGDLVFRDPAVRSHESWLPARSYLSGNVAGKVREARARAQWDPGFLRNVEALEAALPPMLGMNDVSIFLGSPCVSSKDIADFTEHLVGSRIGFSYDSFASSWELSFSPKIAADKQARWGTPGMSVAELIGSALNGKAPIVYEDAEHWEPSPPKDPERTAAAIAKMTEIQEYFSTWVWGDADRSARILKEYNDRFNGFVARENDGSHLRLEGMSASFTPYPWQLGFVDMALSMPAALCGHKMGSGKTRTMAMLAAALRQFGLARKPLIVVPNHVIEDVSRELQQTFPVHSFLIASKEDLSKHSRRKFVARCAAGDWAAVVMTQSAFSSITVSPATEAMWVEDQVWALRESSRGELGSKALSRRERSARTALGRLRADARHDGDQVFFENLGVDYLMIDEAHSMKRLSVTSRTAGFASSGSKRATDLLLKINILRQRRPGMPVASLFTGTPWTNSLSESWVWLKYLAPDVLSCAGLSEFDSFASVFVRRTPVVEVAPDGGGFRVSVRPRIENAQEMKSMLATVADILTTSESGLKVPERVLHSISVKPSHGQRQFVGSLVERAEAIRGARRTTDNMLSICTDGRKAALDPALAGIGGEAPKISRVAQEVAAIYHFHKDDMFSDGEPGALQVAFCDLGTPNAEHGPQTYGRLKQEMTARGVPAGKIRFVHEAKDDKARAALYADCRSGAVSVLLGSTEKLGTGTNIQNRLAAIHHVDAPWRASDVEQREGRGIRPHNSYPSVGVFRYVTERTFDAYMWQTLESKAASFAVFYDKQSVARSLDDIGEVAPDYAEMKALASGSPLLVEQAKVGHEVRRLRMLQSVDRQSVGILESSIRELKVACSLLASRSSHLADVMADWVPDVSDNLPALARQIVVSLRKDKYLRRLPWRELTLTRNTRDEELITVNHNLSHVGYVSANAEDTKCIARGSIERGTKVMERLLSDFWAGIPALADESRERLTQARVELDSATEARASHVFAHGAELRAAELRWQEITRVIESQAEEGRGARAAQVA